MARIRHLQRAPVKEAIIDLRATVPESFDARSFIDLKIDLAERYPSANEMLRMEGGVQVEEGRVSSFTRHHGLRGYLFRSSDGLQVVQFRIDGFTFSRLEPYTSWDEVFPEAFTLWQLFARKARVELATRLAVRYINRLRLPAATRDFSRYLVAPPAVPSELRVPVSAFLSRVLLHDAQHGLSANVTQAFEGGVDPAVTGVLLDIDAFAAEQRQVEDEAIRDRFERLREFKNRIFFSSITEEAARLFE